MQQAPLACQLKEAKTNTATDAITSWYTSDCSGVHRLFCNWLNQVFQYRRWRKPVKRRDMVAAGRDYFSLLLLLVLLLLKNVFLCCTTGCMKKAEVTPTIAQTAHSRKVIEDSLEQFFALLRVKTHRNPLLLHHRLLKKAVQTPASWNHIYTKRLSGQYYHFYTQLSMCMRVF